VYLKVSNKILGLYFAWQSAGKSKLYTVYMKVYYLFTLCLFKGGLLFSKLAIPKYMFVFVIKLSKEKTYFMYGWFNTLNRHPGIQEIFLHPSSTIQSWHLTHYSGNKAHNLTQTLMWVKDNTFYVLALISFFGFETYRLIGR
jgi:hypothetical protein